MSYYARAQWSIQVGVWRREYVNTVVTFRISTYVWEIFHNINTGLFSVGLEVGIILKRYPNLGSFSGLHNCFEFSHIWGYVNTETVLFDLNLTSWLISKRNIKRIYISPVKVKYKWWSNRSKTFSFIILTAFYLKFYIQHKAFQLLLSSHNVTKKTKTVLSLNVFYNSFIPNRGMFSNPPTSPLWRVKFPATKHCSQIPEGMLMCLCDRYTM